MNIKKEGPVPGVGTDLQPGDPANRTSPVAGTTNTTQPECDSTAQGHDSNHPISVLDIPLTSPQRFPSGYDPTNFLYLMVLQACERRHVPYERWPRSARDRKIVLPPEPLRVGLPSLPVPPLDLFNPEEWARRFDKEAANYKLKILDVNRPFLDSMIVPKKTRRSGPKRNIPPAPLVCDWVVRHSCLRESWVAIARSQSVEPVYSLNQIRKHGRAVLRKLGLGISDKRLK